MKWFPANPYDSPANPRNHNDAELNSCQRAYCTDNTQDKPCTDKRKPYRDLRNQRYKSRTDKHHTHNRNRCKSNHNGKEEIT